MQSIAEQLPAEELDQRFQNRQRQVDRWLHIVAVSAISIVVVSVLWGIIYEIMIVKGEVVAGSIFLAFVVGLILFASLAIYRESLAKASGKRQPAPHGISQAEDTAKLPNADGSITRRLPESSAESIPSVTERTTDLFRSEKNEDIK